MNYRTARAIHTATNLAYWMENPNWHTGNRLADSALKVVRKLPFSVHQTLNERFYDTNQLIAVNGESVVVHDGPDRVSKFMFQRPGKMALEAFRQNVDREIGVVTRHLAGVALETSGTIQPARIFRNPATKVEAVAQSQVLLDLDVNAELRPQELSTSSPTADRTARDLEHLINGSARMLAEDGYYADVAQSGGNLRINQDDGAVTLIDVMPFYENGDRLIGGAPPNVIPHIQQNLAAYETFVGQYGA